MELMGCADLAVPREVMHHVVRIESSFNPYAIGVVGGRLARQPRSLPEAVSTARMLEERGYNFSLGLAQVNRHNLASQGLATYEMAFDACPNLRAGARILADCHRRAGEDWGKALSCYYSGNFVTGFRHGYVQKVLASWRGEGGSIPLPVIGLVERRAGRATATAAVADLSSIVARRIQEAVAATPAEGMQPQPSMPLAAPVAAASQAVAIVPPQPGTPAAIAPEASRSATDGPVVVQPMNAVPAQSVQGSQLPAVAGPPISPGRDDAFVF
ncbi:lytic transglycosylase domain-containing protein [Luteimonas marina]|uniref:Lytic transglycosylase domain-containing protein n=1 Tax=Luteimonas marina TaxID=488485 RepID=A0A5C5TUF0_9GAMM|nr:lytic transglycosylase domain-containing protein [Luteimonas marina]